jgi:hypothetical protein
MLKYLFLLFIFSCSPDNVNDKILCGTLKHSISKCYILSGGGKNKESCFCRDSKDDLLYQMKCKFVRKNCVISIYFEGEY